MAKLIYSAIASLDGYIEDEGGRFDWGEPGPDALAFINELERSMGVYLYGRRMYETMVVWETDPELAKHSAEMQDFAVMWQAAEKVVYSSTLEEVATTRTRLERSFDPEAVRALKESAATDIGISGPALAGHAFAAGLVDECQIFFAPVIVGGGKPGLPEGVRLDLELLDQRRFESGMVFHRYAARG